MGLGCAYVDDSTEAAMPDRMLPQDAESSTDDHASIEQAHG
jgi:hypothetical protein